MKADENNSQKAIALIFILFLLFVYKETVLDRFFNPPKETQAVSSSNETARQALQNTPLENSSGVQPLPQQGPTSEPGLENSAASIAQGPRSGNPKMNEVRQAGLLIAQTEEYQARVSLLGGRMF